METALTEAGNKLQNQATHQANVVFIELILAAGLGLLGTIASIALSLIIGRGLVRQLRELRESALTLAHEKLPSVITQLRAGQPVDAERVRAGRGRSGNEIEQVQYAFNIVQQTAVQTAIDEARLRRGISDVFRNLAGRSQSLLHRQLDAAGRHGTACHRARRARGPVPDRPPHHPHAAARRRPHHPVR